MKVIVISTTILPAIPPTQGGYGGLEFVAWMQANGLARRGHEVMLIAPNGSVVPDGVTLHGTTLRESEERAYSGYWQKLPWAEIVIDNSWQKWAYILKIEGKLKVPILAWMHAPIDTMYNSPPPVAKPCLVAISQDQADHISERWGCIARVCYNAVDADFYKAKPGSVRTDRYLFLARFSTIKGPHIALDVARACRVGLDLVGDDRLTAEPALAQRIIAQATHNIKYVGPVTREQTLDYYSTHKAMLHMNKHFREPFGLAPVEAQCCGLPVIAWNHGAMRETIKHGETGFLVNTQEEVEKLVKDDAVAALKPERCREWASQFSPKRQIDTIEELCKEAVEGGW